MNSGDEPALNTLVLTSLEEFDAPALHAWRHDPVVRDGALAYPVPSSITAEIDWIRSFAPKGAPGDVCLAVRAESGAPIVGYCQLRSIDWVARCAEYGMVIGAPQARGRGVGRRALQLSIDYARAQLGLRRIWLRVVAYNDAAIKLYRGAGFVEEGRLVQHVFRNGAYHDVLVYGLKLR
jgi:RimJ/RimL family protein N-acetyltransferase